MHKRHAAGWSRREFLEGLALAGAAGVLGLKPELVAAEPPPETRTIRLIQAALCVAPQYVAEELLRGEGFTDVQYVKVEPGKSGRQIPDVLVSHEADMSMFFAAPTITRLDVGEPLIILAGGHIGCFELFGTEQVHAIHDLKGKTVAVETGLPGHIFLASMLAYVGLDPSKDLNVIPRRSVESLRLFTEGKIDAYLGFPPETQELRAKKIGHVVINSSLDRPWSQYFCCMVIGHREFVQQHPVATKRALRAILKANQMCALEPERTARLLVEKGFTASHDHALQTLKEIPYGKWAEYNPEDTVRFYALRLHEAGMIKSSPQKIIAEGTDWRFLNELKKEMKG
ncbi:MAG: ABC transporter substrate-binding protein [Deltaproteobacteria bacterium]|nr:ABC transporter substrate-binding protein [Deltaproteobacteria bacterium]